MVNLVSSSAGDALREERRHRNKVSAECRGGRRRRTERKPRLSFAVISNFVSTRGEKVQPSAAQFRLQRWRLHATGILRVLQSRITAHIAVVLTRPCIYKRRLRSLMGTWSRMRSLRRAEFRLTITQAQAGTNKFSSNLSTTTLQP